MNANSPSGFSDENLASLSRKLTMRALDDSISMLAPEDKRRHMSLREFEKRLEATVDVQETVRTAIQNLLTHTNADADLFPLALVKLAGDKNPLRAAVDRIIRDSAEA
jgi:hypothetical protein